MDFIKFEISDLLNYVEIEQLITTPSLTVRATLISTKLLNYILINSGMYYKYDPLNVLYLRLDEYNEEKLLTTISEFIYKSFTSLKQEDKAKLETNYKNRYDKIFENISIKKNLPQIKTYLTNDKVDFFDPHLNEIHFRNGYYDFHDNTFKQRIKNKHFINVNINRDFHEPEEKDKLNVMEIIKLIYSNEDDRNYLLMTLGIAITGQACDDQTMLFLLGLGSSGKSTIMELTKLSVEDYVYTLPKTTFSKGNKDISKILNIYLQRPYIRISHINEMEDTKMDESLLKDHTDGNIQTTTLYRDGCNDFKHYSKMVFTANTFPNIKIDTGTERRIDAYEHRSHFTENKDEVDEKNNIYYKNVKLLRELKHDNKFLNAFISILFEYGYNWIKNTKIYKQTPNFLKTKAAVITCNDIMQDFIDKAITITNNNNDRLGRDEMYDTFKILFPASRITKQQFINSIKQKKIIFEPDYRLNGVKGCFIGVAYKHDRPNEDALNKIINVEDDYKIKYEELKNQLEDMTKLYNDLLNKNNKKELNNISIISKYIYDNYYNNYLHDSEYDLYEHYIQYCAKNNYKIIEVKVFINNLKSLNILVKQDKKNTFYYKESKEELENNEALNKILRENNFICEIKEEQQPQVLIQNNIKQRQPNTINLDETDEESEDIEINKSSCIVDSDDDFSDYDIKPNPKPITPTQSIKRQTNISDLDETDEDSEDIEIKPIQQPTIQTQEIEQPKPKIKKVYKRAVKKVVTKPKTIDDNKDDFRNRQPSEPLKVLDEDKDIFFDIVYGIKKLNI